MNYLGLLLIAFASCANAVSCIEHDYAQLKDEAKTESGRIVLRHNYCIANNGSVANSKLAAMYSGRTPYEAEVARCESQKKKILGALQEAGDHQGVRFALAGCPK